MRSDRERLLDILDAIEKIDGKEFCIAEADDFDKEVEMLRQSRRFSDS